MFPKRSHVLDVSCKCEQTGLLWKCFREQDMTDEAGVAEIEGVTI